MTIVLALIAGLFTFFISAFFAGLITSSLANAHQLFALLFRVQPYKTVFTLVIGFGSAWAGFSVFDAIA